MFSYKMVDKELEALFQKASLLRSSLYESMINTQKNDDVMVTAKLAESGQHLNQLVTDLQDLKRKINEIRKPEIKD